MKQRLLVTLTAATFVVAGSVVSAGACEHEKSARAAAAVAQSKACTAEMAAKCTPAQAAACKAKMSAATAAGHACASKGTTAAMASGKACSGKKTAAVAVAASNACCAKKSGAANTMAAADGYDAVVVGGGHSCSGQGMTKAADMFSHAGCDACEDMAMCESELRGVGAQSQIVPLKNGVMIVYTAEAPKGIRAVQAAMARRSDRLGAIASSADKSTLCPECKYMRGALASGKLSREIVNIEGGCLTLMTSNDKAVVARLHGMSGVPAAARIKS